MRTHQLLAVLSLTSILLPPSGASPAPTPGRFVSLVLVRASAEREGHDTLFQCKAILDNATGKELRTHSNFFSVFDGLELVVTTPQGTTVAQEPYTFHQSPSSASGKDFILKPGRTESQLVFPIADLPPGVQAVRVRLVGALPGSDYPRILSSATLDLKIRP